MSRGARTISAMLGAAVSLCGCAPALIVATEPKTVTGRVLPPYESQEECIAVMPGDRVDYAFESTQPVDFNIHFHEGKTIVMPVVREKSRGDAGMYAPPIGQHYCLMWEAGAAGATIDYRIRFRPAGN